MFYGFKMLRWKTFPLMVEQPQPPRRIKLIPSTASSAFQGSIFGSILSQPYISKYIKALIGQVSRFLVSPLERSYYSAVSSDKICFTRFEICISTIKVPAVIYVLLYLKSQL